jgi:hypothetical protein
MTGRGAGGRGRNKWLAVGNSLWREEEMAWEETEVEGRRFG